jgi:glycosyltransferase involved in cell wall biosynthesis
MSARTAPSNLLIFAPSARTGGPLQYTKHALPRIIDRWPGRTHVVLPDCTPVSIRKALQNISSVDLVDRRRLMSGSLHILNSQMQYRRACALMNPAVSLILGNQAYIARGVPSVVLLQNAMRLQHLRRPQASARIKAASLPVQFFITGLAASHLICVSQHLFENLPSRFRRKASVIRFGVTIESTHIKPSSDWQNGPMLIPGSDSPYRGVERALRVFRQWLDPSRRARITIDPSIDRKYNKFVGNVASRLNLAEHVEWLGQIPHHQMIGEMVDAACVVISSRIEACPNLLFEAAAANTRRPIFGFRDLWTHEFAPLFDTLVETKQEVNVSLLPTESSPETIARRIRFLDEHTWDACAERTVDVLLATAHAERG